MAHMGFGPKDHTILGFWAISSRRVSETLRYNQSVTCNVKSLVPAVRWLLRCFGICIAGPRLLKGEVSISQEGNLT